MTDTELKTRFAAARRAVIEGDFSDLNQMQRRAVMKTEGPLLLLAGAGSGKTTVLINRIANLIKYGRGSDSDEAPPFITQEELDVVERYAATRAPELKQRAESLCAVEPAAPWSIIAITFTNKAANELKDRLENLLGPSGRDVWAFTFHSACVRILRRDIERLGYTRSFTIYDTADSERVMKDVIKSFNLDDKAYPPRSVLNQISKLKDMRNTPRDFTAWAEKQKDRRMTIIGSCYAEYQKRLKDSNALDFDDIISLTVTLLTEHQDVREYYQKKFRYVLIDEYQDTNNLQYLLAGLLAGGRRNICVVGDDDQSIYRFRGATIENILNFENEYKDACVIRLEQNYRSTGTILDAANAVICNNVGRKGKRLWTDKGAGQPVIVYTAMNENDEAQFVAASILKGYAQSRRWSDFAVLYRMNAQSNQLEYAFKRNAIPYRVVGGTRFFDRAEVKDMLAYLCLINNRADDVRLKRVVNNPPRGIGARSVEIAEEIARERGVSIFSVISCADEIPELKRAAPKLGEFVRLINALDAQKDSMPLTDFYDLVVSETGYISMLEKKGDAEARGRAENVNELKSSIAGFIEANPDGASLSGFLDEVALYTDLEGYDQQADCVVMMTIHSAKGLEFPTVFIVGAEEGIFPGLRSIGEKEEMEEERRLCYVAITRARRQLYITAARQRMLFGRTSSNRLSRFVGEIPPDLIQSQESAANYSFGAAQPASPRLSRPPQGEKRSNFLRPRAQKAAPLQLNRGDMVEHTAFGRGMVLSIQKMGGDALLEIAFDDVGTKRLMLNTAGKHMTRL